VEGVAELLQIEATDGAAETAMLQAVVAEVVVTSTTFAVKLTVPEEVGLPVMAPVDVLRLRPPGRDPTVE
jgi:hypothetical protein